MVKKEKHDFYMEQKCSEYKIKKKEKMIWSSKIKSLVIFKYTRPAVISLIIGDSILIGVNKKQPPKNDQVVKV